MCIAPLPFKEIEMRKWWNETPDKKAAWDKRMRLLFFDPKEVYERAGGLIDPYKRNQSNLSTKILFPLRTDGQCRCGCGRQAKKYWYDDYCKNFAYDVYQIICYGTAHSKILIREYYGDLCQAENCTKHWTEIDHIIPVKHGGGGCWLSNYLPLCAMHHVDKTNKDFKRKQYKETNQLNLFNDGSNMH
jgi:hypothetical protein